MCARTQERGRSGHRLEEHTRLQACGDSECPRKKDNLCDSWPSQGFLRVRLEGITADAFTVSPLLGELVWFCGSYCCNDMTLDTMSLSLPAGDLSRALSQADPMQGLYPAAALWL